MWHDSCRRMFESDVISDSGKTCIAVEFPCTSFESDVISDSGKTAIHDKRRWEVFESDVISDSGKTALNLIVSTAGV